MRHPRVDSREAVVAAMPAPTDDVLKVVEGVRRARLQHIVVAEQVEPIEPIPDLENALFVASKVFIRRRHSVPAGARNGVMLRSSTLMCRLIGESLNMPHEACSICITVGHGQSIPVQRGCVVLRHTPAVFVHVAEVVLARGAALRGGKSKVMKSLRIVLRNAMTVFVLEAEGDRGGGVAGSSVGRLQARRHRQQCERRGCEGKH